MIDQYDAMFKEFAAPIVEGTEEDFAPLTGCAACGRAIRAGHLTRCPDSGLHYCIAHETRGMRWYTSALFRAAARNAREQTEKLRAIEKPAPGDLVVIAETLGILH